MIISQILKECPYLIHFPPKVLTDVLIDDLTGINNGLDRDYFIMSTIPNKLFGSTNKENLASFIERLDAPLASYIIVDLKTNKVLKLKIEVED